VHDPHATLLHHLGMYARQLTYQPHGLTACLIDQYPARVIKEILT